MRSRYIPEEVRSTVMNIFRMGLNFIVVIVLANIDSLTEDTVFMLCCLLLSAAAVAQHRLFRLTSGAAAREGV